MKRMIFSLLSLLLTCSAYAQGEMKKSGPDGGPTNAPTAPNAPNGEMNIDLQQRRLTVVVNKDLDELVSKEWEQRGLFKQAASAALQTAQTGFTGAVTSLVELGVDQLYKLVTRNKRRHNTWLEVVHKQNQWTDTLTTINDVKDFYTTTSSVGAMDPKGMQFDGFDYQQNNSGAQAFHIHCSIDKSEEGMREIANHGNFKLVIDTLYINPYLCNLPNASGPNRKFYAFNFEEGADKVSYKLKLSITSSWMNQAIEYFRNQTIGEFSVALDLSEGNLNATDAMGRKVFSYVRGDASFKGNAPQITGKSLLVPRSYIGKVEDELQNTKDVWSTGEYNIKLALNETRRIDDNVYWNNPKNSPNYWKDDYARRTNSTSRTLYSWYVQNFGENGETIVTKIVSAAAKPFITSASGFLFPTSAEANGKSAVGSSMGAGTAMPNQQTSGNAGSAAQPNGNGGGQPMH